MATVPSVLDDPFGIIEASRPIPQNGNPQAPAKPNAYAGGTGYEPPLTGTLTNAIRALPASLNKTTAMKVVEEHYKFALDRTDDFYVDPFKRKYQKQARTDVEKVWSDFKSVLSSWGAGSYIRASDQFNYVISTIGRIYGNISALTDEVKVVTLAQEDLGSTFLEAGKFTLFGLSGISLVILLVMGFLLALPFILQAKGGIKSLF